MKRKMRVFANLSVVTLVVGAPLGAGGTTVHLQNISQLNPNLIHQWSFDGGDNAARRQDQSGTAHLNEVAGGSATTADISYGVPGFDATSDAVTTFRQIPGSDSDGGAAFNHGAVTLGSATSYEVVFRPSEAEIAGGSFNLGYILATRVGGNRGYFLMQGSAEQNGGGPLARTAMTFPASSAIPSMWRMK